MEAKSLFADPELAEHYKKFRPRPPEELILKIVAYIKEKYPAALKVAVDVGCGSGQCTTLLAPHFERVIGCDTSKEQIQKAKQNCKETNIFYCSVSAEQLPFPHTDSVQLVTAVTAAHWFSLDAFFKEVERVLVPGGVVALIAYAPIDYQIECGDVSEELSNEVSKMLNSENGVCGIFYSKFADKIKLVLNEYKDIVLPFAETISFRNEPWLIVKKTGHLDELIGYFKTFSGWLDLIRREGEEKANEIIEGFRNRCRKIIGDDADNKEITVGFRYFAIVGRKPL